MSALYGGSPFYPIHQSAVPITHTGDTLETKKLSIPIAPGLLIGNNSLWIRATACRTTGASKIGFRIRLGADDNSGSSIGLVEHDTEKTLLFDFSLCAQASANAQIVSANIPSGAMQGAAPPETAIDMTQLQYLTFWLRTEGNPADILALQARRVWFMAAP